MKRPTISVKNWKIIIIVVILAVIIAIALVIIQDISLNQNFSIQEKRRLSSLTIVIALIIAFFGTIVSGYAHKYRNEIWEQLKILNLKRRIKKGDNNYKKQQFLSAYELYQAALLDSKKLRNSRNLVDTITEKEANTFEKLDLEVQTKTEKFLKGLKELKVDNKHTLIIEKCTKFLRSIASYPNTAEIEMERERVQKESDVSIEKLCEIKYNQIRSIIKHLLKNKENEKAIKKGKEFLTMINSYPDVKGVRLARDGIVMLIEPPINKKWNELFEKIQPVIRVPGTPQEFQKTYTKIDQFLSQTEEDKNFSEVEALRTKVLGRLQKIRETEPLIGAKDEYDSFVSRAQDNFNSESFQRAIFLTQKAIELVTDPDSEIIKVIVNQDTSTHIALSRFKYYCRDKITESQITRLINEADELYANRDIIGSKAKLQEALNLYNQLSPLFRDFERRRYKGLYDEIRRKLNRE